MDIKKFLALEFIIIAFADKIFCSTISYNYVDAKDYISSTKQFPRHAKYLKEYFSKVDRFKVDSLEGLNDILKPVEHCFIHITNFGGVDLPGIAVPSILMKTKLSVCDDYIYAISSSLNLRRNLTSSLRRLGCYDYQKPGCPLSSLFANSQRLCVELNFRKFVTSIRPWTCEVTLSLYQKLGYDTKVDYKHRILVQNSVTIFDETDPKIARYVFRSIPSYAPINILITEHDSFSLHPTHLISTNAVGVWFRFSLTKKLGRVLRRIKAMFRDTFFVVSTKPLGSETELQSNAIHAHKIDRAFAIQLRLSYGKYEIHFRYCDTFLNHEKFRWRDDAAQIKLFDASFILEFIFSTTLFHEGTTVTEEKFLFEAICKNIDLNWAFTLTQTNTQSYSVNWIGQWLQILQLYNYTISFDDKQIYCRNEHYILYETELTADVFTESYITELNNFFYPTAVSHPLLLKDANRKMSFIACGSTAMQALPFRELFRVFDEYVWACIIIFNWKIMPIILCGIDWLSENNQRKPNDSKKTLKSVFSSRVFFQPVIILLEQGSAFTAKHLDNAATRWVAAALILVAVVLSNSYKYDNVYNMMLSRQATPPWFFQQLLSENFSIYTRTDFINHPRKGNYGFTAREKDWKREFELSNHAAFFIDELSVPQVIYSELFNIYELEIGQLVNLLGFLMLPCSEKNVRKKVPFTSADAFYKDIFVPLLRNTKLYSNETTLPNTLRNPYGYNSMESLIEEKRYHESSQFLQFMKILNECHNAAIVLPYSKILSLFYKLRNQGNIRFTVGKEVLLERSIGMILQGWISSHLTNTLGWLEDFGVWQHVRNMYETNVTSISDASSTYSHRTSQISGNVMMVFATLLVGHLLAIISFVIEIRKRILAWLLKYISGKIGENIIFRRFKSSDGFCSFRCTTILKMLLLWVYIMVISSVLQWIWSI
ncbi:unnamed protein product [Orchesella dallaii]|uniref:Uncharacterized protein n=1 Tax=Orchesella dallaii TaxID=48710 RepID=A0ABP1S0E6_9HEXA